MKLVFQPCRICGEDDPVIQYQPYKESTNPLDGSLIVRCIRCGYENRYVPVKNAKTQTTAYWEFSAIKW